MTGDVDPGDLDIVETGPAGDAHGDVIHGRAQRPPVRWPMRPSWLAGLLAAALLAGIGIGYLVGRPDGGKPAAAPTTPRSTTPRPVGSVGSLLAELPQLITVGPNCVSVSANAGHPLAVGVKLANDGPRPVVLSRVRAVFPLGGLRQLDSRIAHCDVHASDPVQGHTIPPAGTARVSLNLAVLVRCPGPLPVQLRIDYTVDGRPVTQTLSPFRDLGNVPYPGCPAR